MLLKLAVEASIPLVSVESDDPMNIRKILGEVLGVEILNIPKTVESVAGGMTGGKLSPKPGGKSVYNWKALVKGGVYMSRFMDWRNTDFESVYSFAAKVGATVILVNPETNSPAIFKTGYVGCPISMVEKFVTDYTSYVKGTDEFSATVSAMSGLSYQQLSQVALLAQANSGELSATSVREVRRIFFGTVRGLMQENTEAKFYKPSDVLTGWMALDGQLFAENAPAALRPRGLLFDGPPGTGKTEGARYIARQLSLPLYRLDIGATMGKYVGESEKGLEAALAQADRCAPCVMLIDEVEKLFGQHSDGGTTTRALSQLLWWLQEHQSRVVTIMTTNDKGKLPPELIRPGRIDKQMLMDALTAEEAKEFVTAVAGHYKDIAVLSPTKINSIVLDSYPPDGPKKVSHASLTDRVMSEIKKQYLSTTKKK